MKRKVTIARGEVVYKYKNKFVLEIPDGTYRKAMYYDDSNNRTEVILSKHGLGVEVICSILLLAMVLLKIIGFENSNVVHYDSTPDYRSGVLYLNIKNTSDNDITVELWDNDEILLRKHLVCDEEFLTIEIEDVKVEYILKVKERHSIFDNEYVRRLSVNNLDNINFYDMQVTE